MPVLGNVIVSDNFVFQFKSFACEICQILTYHNLIENSSVSPTKFMSDITVKDQKMPLSN